MHRDIDSVTRLEERPEGMALVAYKLDRVRRIAELDDSEQLIRFAVSSEVIEITPWDSVTFHTKGDKDVEVHVHRD